ncbi:MAG: hypothetical protein EOM37_18790 [Proteobacteria bacterium]|nr:hypothetical protein [Pseudomonadota bacterium]
MVRLFFCEELEEVSLRQAARYRHGLGARRNSFSGLVELNRCVQDGKLMPLTGNDSTNDAWISQTADGPQDHDAPGPCGVERGDFEDWLGCFCEELKEFFCGKRPGAVMALRSAGTPSPAS